MDDVDWGDSTDFLNFCQSLELVNDQISCLKEIKSFGWVASKGNSMLTYVETEQYANIAAGNSSIKVVIAKHGVQINSDVSIIYVENPKFTFWSLFEFHSRLKELKTKSIISSSAKIGKNVSISEVGVFIGERVIIEDNVVINSNVMIGDDTKVGHGSVIGSLGLEVKETVFGLIPVSHDAGVKIKNNVTICALSSINKGLLGHDTIISQFTFIDCGVNVGHSSVIGEYNVITANATIGGSVKTGKNVFVGINSTIVNGIEIPCNSFIGAGAIAVRSHSEPVKLLAMPSKNIPF